MGIVTLAGYRSDLDGALQRTVSDALKDKWVNQAIREFAYAFKFHELEAEDTIQLGLGGNTTNLPTDFRALADSGHQTQVDARPSEISPLKVETHTRYRRLIGDITDSTTWGKPLWLHRFGNEILFRPASDLANGYNLTFGYWKKITPLAAAGDVSQFDEDWDDIILLGALYRGHRYFGEYDRFQNIKADFVGSIRSRITEMELEDFPEGGVSPVGPEDTAESIQG